ncbi:MAG: hypothetical protein WDN07_03585 [Actinomycetota bacterium]
MVDHLVLHLPHLFDYEVPEVLSEVAGVGALVEIEFGHVRTQGLITDRLEHTETTGALKPILKVLSNLCPISSQNS